MRAYLHRAHSLEDRVPVAKNQAALGIGLGEVELIENTGTIFTRGYVGRMKASMLFGDSDRQIDTRFGKWTWADDFTAFLNRQPRKTWIVGRSRHSRTDLSPRCWIRWKRRMPARLHVT